jgi:hypothetical protein
MPNDYGLRQCVCGNYLSSSDLIKINKVEKTDCAPAKKVKPEELKIAITKAGSSTVELVARLEYWHLLNHPYREKYRNHRECEEIASRVEWENANPDRRTILQRALGIERQPKYKRSPHRKITFPPFTLSNEQSINIDALILLILAVPANSKKYSVELVELYRQCGRFADAEVALDKLDQETFVAFISLTRYLIEKRQSVLARYGTPS